MVYKTIIDSKAQSLVARVSVSPVSKESTNPASYRPNRLIGNGARLTTPDRTHTGSTLTTTEGPL